MDNHNFLKLIPDTITIILTNFIVYKMSQLLSILLLTVIGIFYNFVDKTLNHKALYT